MKLQCIILFGYKLQLVTYFPGCTRQVGCAKLLDVLPIVGVRDHVAERVNDKGCKFNGKFCN